MKKSRSLLVFVLTLFSITLNSSCATSQRDLPPALENRTLRLSPDVPGFEYDYEVCTKKFLGICTKREMKRERYDITNIAIRQQLIDKGFVLRVREVVK